MTVYEHRTSLTTASGSVSTFTLPIRGGLIRQLFVKANTANTVFRLNMQDQNNLQRLDYGFHTGTLNETQVAIPVAGRCTFSITNASPDDTFAFYVGVEE